MFRDPEKIFNKTDGLATLQSEFSHRGVDLSNSKFIHNNQRLIIYARYFLFAN